MDVEEIELPEPAGDQVLVNLQFGGVHGFEFAYEFSSPKPRGEGWDAYVNYTYSTARPNGVDNTGAPVPEFNDHDQRNTVGFGVSYSWKSGASAGICLRHFLEQRWIEQRRQ